MEILDRRLELREYSSDGRLAAAETTEQRNRGVKESPMGSDASVNPSLHQINATTFRCAS
jgi:hypothetical protein